MNRLLLVIAFISTLFCRSALAQDAKSTYDDNGIAIGVGYGILPDIQVFYGSRGFLWSWHTYENTQVTGFSSLRFQYTAFGKVSVALFTGMESEYGTMNYNPNASDKQDDWETIVAGNFSRTVLKYGVEMSGIYQTTYYGDDQFCSVYGTLGAAWYNIFETDTYLAGHLTPGSKDSIVKNNPSDYSYYVSPLGVRYGYKRLSIYGEIGIGYKGLFNGGIMYSLNKRRKAKFD